MRFKTVAFDFNLSNSRPSDFVATKKINSSNFYCAQDVYKNQPLWLNQNPIAIELNMALKYMNLMRKSGYVIFA